MVNDREAGRLSRKLLIGLAVAMTGFGPVAAADEAELRRQLAEQQRVIESLSGRLEALERERADHLEYAPAYDTDQRSVGVFDAMSLDLGGFLTQTLTLAHGDEQTEISPNQTLLEILLRANVTERTSLFTALGWLREADLDLTDPSRPFFRGQVNRTPQIIAWVNHRFRDAFQLRVGRFVTPHGIINIEHFPPTLLEINQPQFLRPFPGATIFPDFLNGAELHGLLPAGPGVLRYSLFAGMFAPEPNDRIAGLRVAWEWDEGLTLGFNASHGSRDDGAGPLANFSTTPVPSLIQNDYDLFGVDLLLDRGRVLWKTELFWSFEHHAENRIGFYTQPAFRLSDRWIAFYRFDFLEPGQGLVTTTEHVLGLNYLPHPLIRIRGAVFLKDYRGSGNDVTVSQLSATVSF